MSIATLFTIAKRWKPPKCPWVDEWVNKMWYIHTKEYHCISMISVTFFKKEGGNSPAVQWLGLGASTAGPGFDPWSGN